MVCPDGGRPRAAHFPGPGGVCAQAQAGIAPVECLLGSSDVTTRLAAAAVPNTADWFLSRGHFVFLAGAE